MINYKETFEKANKLLQEKDKDKYHEESIVTILSLLGIQTNLNLNPEFGNGINTLIQRIIDSYGLKKDEISIDKLFNDIKQNIIKNLINYNEENLDEIKKGIETKTWDEAYKGSLISVIDNYKELFSTINELKIKKILTEKEKQTLGDIYNNITKDKEEVPELKTAYEEFLKKHSEEKGSEGNDSEKDKNYREIEEGINQLREEIKDLKKDEKNEEKKDEITKKKEDITKKAEELFDKIYNNEQFDSVEDLAILLEETAGEYLKEKKGNKIESEKYGRNGQLFIPKVTRVQCIVELKKSFAIRPIDGEIISNFDGIDNEKLKSIKNLLLGGLNLGEKNQPNKDELEVAIEDEIFMLNSDIKKSKEISNNIKYKQALDNINKAIEKYSEGKFPKSKEELKSEIANFKQTFRTDEMFKEKQFLYLHTQIIQNFSYEDQIDLLKSFLSGLNDNEISPFLESRIQEIQNNQKNIESKLRDGLKNNEDALNEGKIDKTKLLKALESFFEEYHLSEKETESDDKKRILREAIEDEILYTLSSENDSQRVGDSYKFDEFSSPCEQTAKNIAAAINRYKSGVFSKSADQLKAEIDNIGVDDVSKAKELIIQIRNSGLSNQDYLINLLDEKLKNKGLNKDLLSKINSEKIKEFLENFKDFLKSYSNLQNLSDENLIEKVKEKVEELAGKNSELKPVIKNIIDIMQITIQFNKEPDDIVKNAEQIFEDFGYKK